MPSRTRKSTSSTKSASGAGPARTSRSRAAAAKDSPSPPAAVKRSSGGSGSRKKPTTVVAQVDVGFGNRLFIRGDGPGLSWDRGTLMECVEADRWEWSSEKVAKIFACKLVLNDELWSQGENIEVLPGEVKVTRPEF